MRRLGALALLLLVAGCGGEAPPAPFELGTATARFLAGRSLAIVIVTVTDEHALQSARLEGPEGLASDASSIDATQSPTDVEVAGGDLFAGVPGAAKTVTQTHLIRSVARITVPDVVYYGKSWRDWTVRLVIGEPGAKGRAVTLAAPAPPPPAPAPQGGA